MDVVVADALDIFAMITRGTLNVFLREVGCGIVANDVRGGRSGPFV